MRRILPALLFFIFICYIIILAGRGRTSIFFDLVKAVPLGDKAGHFMLYGVLSFLVNRAIGFRFVGKYGSFCQLGSLGVFSFALIEELSQCFIPNRTADIADLMADAVGIAIFALISRRYAFRRQSFLSSV